MDAFFKFVFMVAGAAYLLGSIPFGLILARVFLGTDVRTIGSGNIGATNVMRTGSKAMGILTLVLDAAKGYAAIIVARILIAKTGPDILYTTNTLLGVAAVAAVVGHIFPVWLKFKGGKGVAVGLGVFLALAPKAVGIVLVVFVLVLAFTRYVSLASMIAAVSFPLVAAALMGSQVKYLFDYICAAVALIILKHHENIRRLLDGKEHRMEFTRR